MMACVYLHHTDIKSSGCQRLTLSSGRVQRLARCEHIVKNAEGLRCKSSDAFASCILVLHLMRTVQERAAGLLGKAYRVAARALPRVSWMTSNYWDRCFVSLVWRLHAFFCGWLMFSDLRRRLDLTLVQRCPCTVPLHERS
jgi:hypothetical protein